MMDSALEHRGLLLDGRDVIMRPVQAEPMQALQGIPLQATQPLRPYIPPGGLEQEPVEARTEAPLPSQMVMGTPVPMLTISPTAMASTILNGHRRVQIREQRQWLEALTGFEQNNSYVMRSEVGEDLFFIRENSNCLERNCLKGQCKPWRMDLYLIGPEGIAGGVQSMTPFVHLERPCTMTCLHYDRPRVTITDTSSGALLGTVLEPFTCCNLKFEVLDPFEESVLETDTTCLQQGLCCRCPCQGIPCNSIIFPVKDSSAGTLVAQVEKYWMWGDFAQCLREWDNFWIHFGAIENPEYKILAVALAIFIQMRFFDRRNRKK